MECFEGVVHVEPVHIHHTGVDDDLAHLQPETHVLYETGRLLSGDQLLRFVHVFGGGSFGQFFLCEVPVFIPVVVLDSAVLSHKRTAVLPKYTTK